MSYRQAHHLYCTELGLQVSWTKTTTKNGLEINPGDIESSSLRYKRLLGVRRSEDTYRRSTRPNDRQTWLPWCSLRTDEDSEETRYKHREKKEQKHSHDPKHLFSTVLHSTSVLCSKYTACSIQKRGNYS